MLINSSLKQATIARCLRVLALTGTLVMAAALPAHAQPRRDTADTAHAALRLLAQQAAAPLLTQWDAQQRNLVFVAADGDSRLPFTPRQATTDPVVAARDFLTQNRSLFGLTAVNTELRFLRAEPDTRLGWAHLRFDQIYNGLPVVGRQLVVHLDSQLRPVAVNGHFEQGIDLPTEPLVTADQATDLALNDLRGVQLTAAQRDNADIRLISQKTKLSVYIDENEKAQLAWSVKILTMHPLGEWQYYVHARRPFVIHAFDSLNEAKRRITYTAGNTTRLPGRKLIDEGERSNDPVAQAAQDGAGTVYDYYFTKFKRDSVDGQGLPIISTVHYGSSSADAENAAWVGELKQMIYGDGGQIFKPLPYGLDVIGHELTHGVTDNTAQLIYEGQSGALNESYSDIMASMIDTANWTIGEQVVKSPPFPVPVMRDMQDPTLGGRYDPRQPLRGIGQPATADQYANLPTSRQYDNGGVHINSGIPNHGAYLVAQALGREKTEQIYYRTLTQYLSPSSDFLEHANATVRAAQDLYGTSEANAVRQVFTQIGISVGGTESLPTPPASSGNLPNVPTQPDQNQPLPQGCRDVIVNGGFESDSTWVQGSVGQTSIIDPQLPHSGKRSAWLGGTDQEPLQLIYQDVAIPANASSVKLSYWRLLHQEFTGLGGLLARDSTFSTVIANTSGDILATVEQLKSSQGNDKYSQAQFDLSQLAGKTIRLAFSSENTRGNVSSFFVDDVVLAVCTAGNAGPATPKPSDANQVFVEGTIQNADTSRGISGAQVFLMRPGITATQAAADGNVTDSEVIALGTSDNNGYYRTSAAVPRGQRYSVIVIAGGFRPIIADGGADIPASASSPFKIDASMRKGR